MHLGVLVDRLIDDEEEPRARQRQHVLVQVGIAARMFRRPVLVAVEHCQRPGRGSIIHAVPWLSPPAPVVPDRGGRREGGGVAVGEAGHLQVSSGNPRPAPAATAPMPSSEACTEHRIAGRSEPERARGADRVTVCRIRSIPA
jgi:hypothetical protein